MLKSLVCFKNSNTPGTAALFDHNLDRYVWDGIFVAWYLWMMFSNEKNVKIYVTGM